MGFSSRFGFSVIELLVALCLMGLLFAIALPAWNRLEFSYRLDSATRRVQTELQNIKMRAAAENLGFQFSYAANSTNYTLQRDGKALAVKPLPDGISISEAGMVRFSPRGTATANRIRLRSSEDRCKHVVVSSTGRIRVCNPVTCAGVC